MMQLVAPAAPNEAAAVLGQRLEKVAHSLGQIYEDANSSAQSIYQVADEGFRRHYELGMHFIEELVLARTPAGVLQLQLKFFAAQFKLFRRTVTRDATSICKDLSCSSCDSWHA
jgi:hypothetical protein